MINSEENYRVQNIFSSWVLRAWTNCTRWKQNTSFRCDFSGKKKFKKRKRN